MNVSQIEKGQVGKKEDIGGKGTLVPWTQSGRCELHAPAAWMQCVKHNLTLLSVIHDKPSASSLLVLFYWLLLLSCVELGLGSRLPD